ncbi:fibronectin type III domain-containing protein [Paenibacillus koleovorans]|uniref:fibronectin type III domain-containing protein n=1 Tax=Paenibacillus koleovorans TaxID=121608 RepID=UPI0013E37235|nr:right-handed parallel beta-helix repeat-containing protein [Paenibacillus koleovorans]
MKIVLRALATALGATALLMVLALAPMLEPSVYAEESSPYLVPATIADDCSADVTMELLDWINAVPDGSTLQFGPDACYQVEGSLYIRNRHNLVFDGNGATFQALTDGSGVAAPAPAYAHLWPRNRAHWLVDGGSSLTFRNMTVIGANPNAGAHIGYVAALEQQPGFELDGVNGATVENTTVSDVYGDFVYVGGNAKNVVVQGNHFDRSGRMGIAITYGQYVTVSGNYIYNAGRSMIDLEPALAYQEIHHIKVTHNDIGPHRLTFFANKGAGGNISDVEISYNEVTGTDINALVGIAEARRSNFKFNYNTGTGGFGSPHGALVFHNIDGIEVIGNSQRVGGSLPGVHSGVAVQLIGSTDVEVRDNVFARLESPSLTQYGPVTVISADGASSNYVHCNNITNYGGVPPASDGSGPCSPTPDTVNPTVPGNVKATAVSASQIHLVWTAATDDNRVASYRIYRDGAEVGATSGTTYSDAQLTPLTAYAYTIKARDPAGNMSAASAIVEVTTLASGVLFHDDFEDGSADGWTETRGAWTVTAAGAGNVYESVEDPLAGIPFAETLVGDSDWTDYAVEAEIRPLAFRGDGAIRLYADYQNSNNHYLFQYNNKLHQLSIVRRVGGTATALAQKSFALSAGTPYTVKAVTYGGGLSFYVNGTLELTASDSSLAAGRTGLYVKGVDVQIDNVFVTQFDLEAPSAPTALTAVAVSDSEAELSWTASTDNIGVAGYKLYRDGMEVATVTAASYHDRGLAAATAYSYTVKAFDAAGNMSAASNAALVTTLAFVLFADDFEDGSADGWSAPHGTWSVVTVNGNRVYEALDDAGVVGSYAETYAGNGAWTDYTMEVRIQPLSFAGDGSLRLLARYQNNNNYYLFQYNNKLGNLYIQKRIGAATTVLAQKSFTLATGNWYTFRVALNGSELSFSIDGIEQLTATDTGLEAGKFGFYLKDTGAYLDDVQVRH